MLQDPFLLKYPPCLISRPPCIMPPMMVSDIQNPFGGPVYHFEAVDSTMDEAARLSDEGVVHGTVVLADYQRQGQGRIPGRCWESRPGESLLFTLVLESAVTGSPFQVPYSLTAGLAVCRALVPYSAGAQIKWPNDVLLDGRKCAGILTRTRGAHIHLGIGINCLQRRFTGSYNYCPASILSSTGKAVRPLELLPLLLGELRRQFALGWSPGAFTDVLFGYGSMCSIRAGLPAAGRILEGILTGIGKKGELLIELPGTKKTIHVASGEISTLHIEESGG